MPPMFEITSCRVVEKHTTHIYKLEEAFNLMSKVVSRARISRILDILSGTLNCEHEKNMPTVIREFYTRIVTYITLIAWYIIYGFIYDHVELLKSP